MVGTDMDRIAKTIFMVFGILAGADYKDLIRKE